MKLSKFGRIILLVLIMATLCAISLQSFAASTPMEAEEEEEILIFDPGVENAPQNSEEVYLYPTGNGTYVEVQEMMDPGVSQEEILADGASTEEYLTPVKIDENTYEYANEDRSLVITWCLTDPNEGAIAIPLAATKYGFNWQLAPNEYTHGTVDLDVSGVAHNLYVNGEFRGSSGYIGFYTEKNDRYSWVEPPLSGVFPDTYLIVSSSQPINFAVKNNGMVTGNYFGKYWVTVS